MLDIFLFCIFAQSKIKYLLPLLRMKGFSFDLQRCQIPFTSFLHFVCLLVSGSYWPFCIRNPFKFWISSLALNMNLTSISDKNGSYFFLISYQFQSLSKFPWMRSLKFKFCLFALVAGPSVCLLGRLNWAPDFICFISSQKSHKDCSKNQPQNCPRSSHSPKRDSKLKNCPKRRRIFIW